MDTTTVTGRRTEALHHGPGVGVGLVSVAELRAAWHAAADGHFRYATTHAGPSSSWLPGPGGLTGPYAGGSAGRAGWCPPVVVPVIGCHGSAGASTLALAVATAAEGPVRVVEAAGAGSSGLSGAATAEVGPTGTGWVRGHRDRVILDRLAQDHPGPAHLPPPEPYPGSDPDPGAGGSRAEGQVPVVLDVGWDVHVIATSTIGWLTAALAFAPVLVLVTTATVPGMARLDAALHTLHTLQNHGADPRDVRIVVAVRGPARRRWPRQVAHAPGQQAQDLLARALVVVPHLPALAVRGLDSGPLPASLVDAGARILALTGLPGPPPDDPLTCHTATPAADHPAREGSSRQWPAPVQGRRPGTGESVHDESHHHEEASTHVR